MPLLVAATVLFPPPPASAQDASRASLIQKRRQAEQLEKEERYAACGKAYVDIYELAPTDRRADEVLYNAGVCYEAAGLLTDAIWAYELLEARMPRSALIGRAIVRRANAHEIMANYGAAADAYERYATTFAGEKDAPQALSNAIVFRRATGDTDRAIAGIKSYVRRYGRKRKEEAAAALFSLAELYEEQGAENKVIDTYERYLKTYGRTGGIDRLLIANAKLGTILWRRSCRGKVVAGVCTPVVVRAATTRIPRCGGAAPRQWQLRARTPSLIRDARRYLETAVFLGERGRKKLGPIGPRRQAALHWFGAARFTLLQERFEDHLAIRFPKGLDFPTDDPRKTAASTKRFTEWLSTISKQLEDLRGDYVRIASSHELGAQWAIAASGNLGEATLHVASLLRHAHIPPSVRRGPYAEDATKAFCDAIKDQADPLEEMAVGMFEHCLSLSSDLETVSEASTRCTAALARLRPVDVPRAREIRGDATPSMPPQSRAALLGEPKRRRAAPWATPSQNP